MKKFKITKGNRVYIVDAKSHIDAISKVKAVKTDEVRDSISQWNPGMSEIGLFQISYKRNGVYQSILVRANSEEQAKQKLLNNLNGVDIIGVNSHPSPHFHEPILDSKMKDDGYYYLLRDAIDLLTKPGAARGWSQPYLEEVQEYMVQKGINPTNVNQWKKKYESLTKDSSIKDAWSGVRSNGVIFNYSDGKYTITHKNGKVETFPGNKFNTVEELFKYIDNIKDSKIKDSGINYGTLFIDLTSPNELTASRIVQELENEIGNNKIAEIRGGSFTPVSEHSDGRLDLDFKEFKNNEWGTNHITLMVRSSLPFLMKTMKDDPKYGAYKLRAELNSKLKQFANKTIYSNKSFTMDSAIKDMPLMFKSNVNMQSLKSNIDNVKNKPNETYINSLNANIQGIIADIEEIKGYEKEGKFNESPALKFSCKNLTAQYYKLLNDPKLQGTLHKLDVPTYKNVLYAEHQAQMLSQVTLKDSAIKDSYGWSYIMAPMKTPGDKDLNLLSKLMSTYYDYIYQDVYDIRKAFAKTTDRRVAINMVKDTPKYQYFIKMLDMVDKDWNAVIRKYPKLKKFNINTTGAERLLYGYYPTTKDFVDEITPVIKKEW